MKENSKMLLGIIVGLLLGLIAFLGANFYLGKDNDENKNEIKEEEQNTNQEQTEGNINKIKVISGDYGDSATTIVLSNGEVYVRMEECRVGNDRFTFICNPIKSAISSYKEYEIENLEYENISGGKFRGLKINATDVVGVYPVMQGQGYSLLTQGLAMVKESGDVEVISFTNILNNNLTPTKITDMTNIVKIVNETCGEVNNYCGYDEGAPIIGDALHSFAVDENGVRHDLYSYFK